MQQRKPVDLEERSRALFDASVAAVDMRVRSRLNVARHAALEVASRRRRRFLRMPLLTAAATMAAAAVIAVALWSAWPMGPQTTATAEGRTSLEDLDIVAASGSGSGDAIDMMKDDVDFYAWVAASADNPAAGDHG